MRAAILSALILKYLGHTLCAWGYINVLSYADAVLCELKLPTNSFDISRQIGEIRSAPYAIYTDSTTCSKYHDQVIS